MFLRKYIQNGTKETTNEMNYQQRFNVCVC